MRWAKDEFPSYGSFRISRGSLSIRGPRLSDQITIAGSAENVNGDHKEICGERMTGKKKGRGVYPATAS